MEVDVKSGHMGILGRRNSMSKGTEVWEVGGGYSSWLPRTGFLWSSVTYRPCSHVLSGPQMDPGTFKILAPIAPFKSFPAHTCTPERVWHGLGSELMQCDS